MRVLFSILFILFGTFAYGQSKDTITYIRDGNKGPETMYIGIPSESGANAKAKRKPMNPGDPSKLNPEALNNIPKKKKSNFSFTPQETPSDVYVPKYWDGKNMSGSQVETAQYLGRIEVETETVRIECRDFASVDGDRIRVYINGKLHRSNVLLDGHYFILEIPLELGYNKVDIQAMNQGLAGPNTAQFVVYDGNNNLISMKKWSLLTGQAATISVMRKSGL